MRGKGHGKRNDTEAGAVRFGVVQGGTSLMEDELNQTSYALIDLLQNMTASVYANLCIRSSCALHLIRADMYYYSFHLHDCHSLSFCSPASVTIGLGCHDLFCLSWPCG